MASAETYMANRLKHLPGRTTITSLAVAAQTGVRTWPTATAGDAKSAARHDTTTGVMHPGTTLTDACRENWPTPQAYSKGKDENSAPGITPLDCAVRPELHKHLWPSPIAEDSESRTSNGTLLDSVREWPTPRAAEGGTDFARAQREGSGGDDLLTAINKMERQDWLTPCSSDANGIREMDGKRSGGLNTQAQLDWRTPNQRDWKGPSAQSWRDRETGDQTPTLPDQLDALRSGQPDPANDSTPGNRPVVLNPAWVGALMGFPVNWLDGVAPPSKRSGTR